MYCTLNCITRRCNVPTSETNYRYTLQFQFGSGPSTGRAWSNCVTVLVTLDGTECCSYTRNQNFIKSKLSMLLPSSAQSTRE